MRLLTPDALSPPRRLWLLTGVVALLLLINFLLRLPTVQVADWGQFAFYDPGTVIKGDMLLAKGYIPTVDFGYTHGLLSLLYGRVGFAILRRTPASYLVFTMLTELVMAWAIARIFIALRVPRAAFFFFIFALPLAIMPAYLTLTHPLEAMCILLALAAQAEGKPAHSLALMTVCIFIKPSMAYVYGFLLLLLILWKTRAGLQNFLGEIFPACIILILLFTSLSLWVGVHPVISTLLPLTGAKTYASTGFGFFSNNGREFWLRSTLRDEFTTPAAIFLIAALAATTGAIWSATVLLRNPEAVPCARPSRFRSHEMLLTVGILHTAFLLGFYGWTGSWTYYSYLPMLALTIAASLIPLRRAMRHRPRRCARRNPLPRPHATSRRRLAWLEL